MMMGGAVALKKGIRWDNTGSRFPEGTTQTGYSMRQNGSNATSFSGITGFATVPTSILSAGLSAAALGVYFMLVAQPERTAWSVEKIANETRDGVARIRRAVTELVERGWLIRGQERDRWGRLTPGSYRVQVAPALTRIENEAALRAMRKGVSDTFCATSESPERAAGTAHGALAAEKRVKEVSQVEAVARKSANGAGSERADSEKPQVGPVERKPTNGQNIVIYINKNKSIPSSPFLATSSERKPYRAKSKNRRLTVIGRGWSLTGRPAVDRPAITEAWQAIVTSTVNRRRLEEARFDFTALVEEGYDPHDIAECWAAHQATLDAAGVEHRFFPNLHNWLTRDDRQSARHLLDVRGRRRAQAKANFPTAPKEPPSMQPGEDSVRDSEVPEGLSFKVAWDPSTRKDVVIAVMKGRMVPLKGVPKDATTEEKLEAFKRLTRGGAWL